MERRRNDAKILRNDAGMAQGRVRNGAKLTADALRCTSMHHVHQCGNHQQCFAKRSLDWMIAGRRLHILLQFLVTDIRKCARGGKTVAVGPKFTPWPMPHHKHSNPRQTLIKWIISCTLKRRYDVRRISLHIQYLWYHVLNLAKCAESPFGVLFGCNLTNVS